MRNRMPEFIIANIIVSFFNFVIILFVLRFILSIFAAYKVYSKEKREVRQREKIGSSTKKDVSIEDTEGNSLDIVHDGVCDTFVLKNDAYIAVIGNERHYFCSWECRQKYLENIKESKSV